MSLTQFSGTEASWVQTDAVGPILGKEGGREAGRREEEQAGLSELYFPSLGALGCAAYLGLRDNPLLIIVR